MSDIIANWFLDKDNRYVRSATCLLCMVVCAVAIWWLYSIPCETWTDLAVDAVMVVVAIMCQAVIWPLLEYIIKHDSVG
jgi:membrane protein YdbS with pleckstrin-like domain